MKSLFVELQTEELPPKALKKLSEAFAAGVHKSLAAQSMLTEESTVKAYGAPRRMGVLITEVLEKSPDKEFEQRLVPVWPSRTPCRRPLKTPSRLCRSRR